MSEIIYEVWCPQCVGYERARNIAASGKFNAETRCSCCGFLVVRTYEVPDVTPYYVTARRVRKALL